MLAADLVRSGFLGWAHQNHHREQMRMHSDMRSHLYLSLRHGLRQRAAVDDRPQRGDRRRERQLQPVHQRAQDDVLGGAEGRRRPPRLRQGRRRDRPTAG